MVQGNTPKAFSHSASFGFDFESQYSNARPVTMNSTRSLFRQRIGANLEVHNDRLGAFTAFFQPWRAHPAAMRYYGLDIEPGPGYGTHSGNAEEKSS